MCGIVAVVTKGKNGFLQREVDIFTQLLFADEVRGSDGTGIFFNTKQGKANIRTLKAPIPSSTFVRQKEFEQACSVIFNESNFVVGHNRLATKGKIDVNCTHPFRESNITLVHNGTLVSQKELHETAAVDSHAICFSMAKIGSKETIKKIDGAFALIWFDSKNKTLNLCRNFQRPLSILDCGSCYIISSEPDLGYWVAKRNGIVTIKQIEVKENTLYSFSIEKMESYNEEPLEFRDKTIWNNYSYGEVWTGNKKTRQVPEKSFSFGESVRFCGGIVRKVHRDKLDSYLEGDILKWQYLKNVVTHNTTDYEDKWRVKVYGTEKELIEWAKECDLVGTVSQTTIIRGVTYYTLTKVKNYVEKVLDTVAQLPVVFRPEEKGDHICEWCQGSASKLFLVEGFNVCHECKGFLQTDYLS